MLGADQQFSINTSFAPQAKRVYSGALETEQFQVYQEFLSTQRTKQQAMQKEYELHKNNSDSAKTISAEMDQLNAQVETYWTTKSAEYPNTYFADFLRSMIFPRPAPFVASQGCKNPDSLKWVNNYNFSVNHYWDNFNFAAPGLIRSPLIDGRIDGYFKNNILQYPDSFLRPTFALIEKARANEEMYKYISLHRLNDAITSEIMGMDKVFVAIAERYFLKEKVSWLDSTAMAKIKDKVLKSKPNLIGNLAPELKLPDSDGNIFSLRQVNAKYTVLLFWEPSCSHCKKVVPQLHSDVWIPLKDKGVEVYTVCTQNKLEDWMKFIAENKLYDWTNVWDPSNTSNYHFLYDIFSTPVIYILDSKKKIVAKRLEVESAFKFLKQMLEQK
jgi:peroxiredoxin